MKKSVLLGCLFVGVTSLLSSCSSFFELSETLMGTVKCEHYVIYKVTIGEKEVLWEEEVCGESYERLGLEERFEDKLCELKHEHGSWRIESEYKYYYPK